MSVVPPEDNHLLWRLDASTYQAQPRLFGLDSTDMFPVKHSTTTIHSLAAFLETSTFTKSTYKSPLPLHENLAEPGRALSPRAPAKGGPAEVHTTHTAVPCSFLAGTCAFVNSHLHAAQLSQTGLTKYTLWTVSNITVCFHGSHLCGLGISWGRWAPCWLLCSWLSPTCSPS